MSIVQSSRLLERGIFKELRSTGNSPFRLVNIIPTPAVNCYKSSSFYIPLDCFLPFLSQTKELMKMPSQKPAVSATKILTTLGAAVAGVAIISGIYLKCKK